MDKIIIKGLEVFAHVGVLPEEKRDGQMFVINAYLDVDLRAAGSTDDLAKTVNYADVCDLIDVQMTAEKYDLIEAAAENIASAILLKYPEIESVDVEIEKPHAPIDMSFKYMGVRIKRKRHSVFLALGSNLGDKESYLDYAIDQLNLDELIEVKQVSTYIVTEPYGDVEQDDFLNGVALIETLYSPEELLAVTQDIENGAGRKRLIHWGPRTLDIDILFYDNEIIRTENLIVPHPEIPKRDFVLKPMYEIAPHHVHPIYNKTVSDMLEELKDKEV